MQVTQFRVRGLAPILYHNIRLANPLDPIVKQIKEITSLRKKTDENYEALFRLEWEGGLYFDEKIGPYIPGIAVDACIKEGARLQKRGRDVERGLQTVEDKIPLEYKGPRTLDKMYEIYRDIRPVSIGGSTTMRCRPMFPEWAASFSVTYNPEILNPKDVEKFLADGGLFCGLMDYRPRYGKFEVISNGNGQEK